MGLKDNYHLVSDNRVPPGYALYLAGRADAHSAGGLRGGDKMAFSAGNTVQVFQQLKHYYAIGARAKWAGCTTDNYFTAMLYAPASTGLTNVAGDFDKVSLGGGLNKIKPVAAGTGAWSMDLTAVFTGTSVLKATPVPSTGNAGWFDYDPDTNVLTPNMDQLGGYDLYDFDVNLHCFGDYVWAGADGESAMDVSNLAGKLLFNTWKIKFEFKKDGGSIILEKAKVTMVLAAMGNV